MASTYSISDLAKEFDLTTRAMRFYEDLGLLQPTRTGPGGRNRTYSNRDRTRLRLTRFSCVHVKSKVLILNLMWFWPCTTIKASSPSNTWA